MGVTFREVRGKLQISGDEPPGQRGKQARDSEVGPGLVGSRTIKKTSMEREQVGDRGPDHGGAFKPLKGLWCSLGVRWGTSEGCERSRHMT